METGVSSGLMEHWTRICRLFWLILINCSLIQCSHSEYLQYNFAVALQEDNDFYEGIRAGKDHLAHLLFTKVHFHKTSSKLPSWEENK